MVEITTSHSDYRHTVISIMNSYVQYIESQGNLVAIKDLSSVFGIFNTHRIASWTLGGSTSTLRVSTAHHEGWSTEPLSMSVVLLATRLKVYSRKNGARYGVRPAKEGDWWVLTCSVGDGQPGRAIAQANHRADVANGWKDMLKGPEMKA